MSMCVCFLEKILGPRFNLFEVGPFRSRLHPLRTNGSKPNPLLLFLPSGIYLLCRSLPYGQVGLIRVLWLQEKESRMASEAKVGLSFPIDTPIAPLTSMEVYMYDSAGREGPVSCL